MAVQPEKVLPQQQQPELQLHQVFRVMIRATLNRLVHVPRWVLPLLLLIAVRPGHIAKCRWQRGRVLLFQVGQQLGCPGHQLENGSKFHIDSAT